MAGEIKTNSFKSRSSLDTATKTERKKPEKRFDKVISGKVTVKPEKNTLKSLFISDDAWKIKDFLVNDFAKPTIQNLLYDLAANTISFLFTGGPARRRGNIGGGNSPIASRISYENCYNDRWGSENSASRRNDTRGSEFDLSRIVFNSKQDAEVVLDAMDEAIKRYKLVRVSDFYDMAQVSYENYMLCEYGWRDIRSARIVSTCDGYIIDMPRSKPI